MFESPRYSKLLRFALMATFQTGLIWPCHTNCPLKIDDINDEDKDGKNTTERHYSILMISIEDDSRN